MAKRNNNQLGFDKGRQLFVDQRDKTLIAVLNHLKAAPITEWCAIHAQYSRIQLLFQDYSEGKGDKSKFAKVNLTAPEVQWIYHCVHMISPLTPKMAYKERFFKEYNGKFSELTVERNPSMRYPWAMTCTIGDCDQNKKPIKGTETKIVQRYNDAQMFQFWSRVKHFVCNWEATTQAALQKHGAPLTKKALEAEKAQQNSSQQPANRYGNNANGQQQRNSQQNNRYDNNNRQQSNNRYTQPSPAPAQQPLAPPPPPGINELDIPFNEMPGYGTGFNN